MKYLLNITIIIMFFCFGFSKIEAQQTLRGHIPNIIKKLNLKSVDRLDGTKMLNLAVGLPVRCSHQCTGLWADSQMQKILQTNL